MGWFDWFDWLVALVKPFTANVQVAAVFIFVTCILFNLASVALNRLIVDIKAQREYMRVQAEYRRLEKEARVTGDKKLRARLRKREAAMKTLGWKTAKQNLLMMLVSFLLFGFVFSVLNIAFVNTPVALLPIPLPPFGDHTPLPFFYWYLICAFAVGRPLYKVLGISLGMGAVATEQKSTETKG